MGAVATRVRELVDRAAAVLVVSSGRSAPRRTVLLTRRTTDAALLLAATVGLVGLVTAVALDPRRSAWSATVVPRAVSEVARTTVAVVNVGSSLAVVTLLLLMIADALRRRRFALVSSTLSCGLALLLGLGTAAVTGVVSGGAFSVLIGQVDDAAGLPVMATVALTLGLGVRRSRRARWLLVVLALAIVCALALGSLTVLGALFAVLAGTVATLAVRVVVGVEPERPAEDSIRQALTDAGWPVVELRPSSYEAEGRLRYAAALPDGEQLSVTVVDPDRRGLSSLRPAWRLLRLRSSVVGRPSLSPRGQLEREALCGSLAGAADVAAPRPVAMIAVGRSLMLVQRPLRGTSLSEDSSNRDVSAVMRALKRLHKTGLAHGSLTADAVVLRPDGEAGFLDLSSAQPVATELQRELDVVALLVAVAGRCGVHKAVRALREEFRGGEVGEARLAALLQPLALPPETRSMVRDTSLLKDVRSALTPASGAAGTTSIRLERLRPRTVVSVAAATVAAHVLAAQLSTVGIVSAFTQARPAWLALAALASAVTYLGSAVALHAFSSAPLSLWRTTSVQLASSFLALIAPPAVGHVGLNVRYLQKAGAPVPVAATTVAVKETVTVAVTLPLLLACGWLSGVSPSRLTLLPSGSVLALLGVVAAVLGLLAALPVTRHRFQRRVRPVIRQTLPQLLDAASDPRRLAVATTGVLLLNGGYVAALDASLHAFAVSLALPTLVVLYLAASALGSAAPTPGGMGAVEAALVGGLTAFGIPFGAALTTVLAFRAVTFWLPAPLGWLVLTRLQHKGVL